MLMLYSENCFFLSDTAGHSRTRKPDPPFGAPDTTCEVAFAADTVGMYFIVSTIAQSTCLFINIYVRHI